MQNDFYMHTYIEKPYSGTKEDFNRKCQKSRYARNFEQTKKMDHKSRENKKIKIVLNSDCGHPRRVPQPHLLR